MNDAQLYFALGVPVFAVVMSIVDTLTGKVVEIVNRLTCVEAMLDRH